jgi:pyruvate kinase
MKRYQFSKRRAKIICTLGPSSDTCEKIMKLAQAGMNVARLNFSHGTHSEHRKLIRFIRKVSRELDHPIAILQDLQGPKIRIQTFEKNCIELKPGQEFTLTTRKIRGNHRIVSVSYSAFSRDVKIGDFVLLDDGLLKLKVIKISGKDVTCRVIFGGILSDHKGLNLPGNLLSVNALTEKDIIDLNFGIRMNVDYIALSFVQKPEDIKEIKRIIEKANRDIPVIAKIEKPQAVDAIDQITDVSDVVMVARGDLGVEESAEEVPPIQKQIISICNKKGIPVITATQMLESMIYNPRPTRAEASDVANAILDGSDAVMLSGETASGKFPVESVQTMHRIVSLIEEKIPQDKIVRRRGEDYDHFDTSTTIGFSSCQAADLIDASMIMCLTQTGSTARMISRFRPQQKLMAITHNESTLRRLSLVWGVVPFSIHEFGKNFERAVTDILKIMKTKRLIRKGDRIVITAGLPFSSKPGTNMLRIEEVNG